MAPRVLMFGWEFPPHISGGLGTACQGLVQGLLTQQVEVLFVLPRLFGGEGPERIRFISASEVDLDVEERGLRELWDRMTFIGIDSHLRPYLDPLRFEQLVQQDLLTRSEVLDRVYRTRYEFTGAYGNDLFAEVARYALIGAQVAAGQEIDVVHAHDWLTYPAGMAAKRITGKPLVVHVHATEFDRSGEHVNQAVYDIERAGMHAADRVITVSELTKRVVVERYGVSEDKVTTVHNAVSSAFRDPSTLPRFPRDKVVSFLGRITFQKGPDHFVEAARKVLQHDDRVRFVMAGSGDMLPKIVQRVAQLRMASRFHFTGFLRGGEVDQLFAMSDVYVMPSVSEPFGISPLEAMRANVPVIISRQSGVAEVLRHALKVDFWDVDAMADAIHGLLHYDALPRMFVRHGREEVAKLKWDHAAQRVRRIYEELLSTST